MKMNKYKLKKGTKALIYLTACALNNKTADHNIFKNESFEELAALAHRHTIGAIFSIASEKADKENKCLTEAQIRKVNSIRAAALKRRVLFDMERERLMKLLEDNDIWYCPLKGIILQDFYPMYEMREMSDNDILFDMSKRTLLKSIMLNEGYTLEDHGVTNHDLYTKEPVYNFEFHTRLFMHTFSTRFTDYYDPIFKKLIKYNKKSERRLSDDDFYIYMIAHAYKHYYEGGTGLRSLTDTYIYNLAKDKTLNRKYIRNECKKLGILEFEQLSRRVSRIFSDPDLVFSRLQKLGYKEREFLSYISFTGSYCTKEDFIKSRLKKHGSKKKYVLSRLFPDENYYKEAHPHLYKNKYLIPAFLIYRAGRMLVKNRSEIIKEIKLIINN